MTSIMEHLVFVDCEAYGGCPSTGHLTEIGAVHYISRKTFYARLVEGITKQKEIQIYTQFNDWLKEVVKNTPIFVSDNPAYDYQWINDGFWRCLGFNPFGHSARRISDFYAGLCGNFRETQKWKRLRITKHDHNPVNDAMGNVEAFERILNGER